jgi:lactoylglutathione lyase
MKYKFISTLIGILTSWSFSFGQIQITGINHVALAVEDIRASTVFYRDIIGLQVLPVPEELKGIRSWFQIAPGQELHLLTGRRSPVDHDKNGSHFSLTIPDADPVEEYLNLKGITYHRQQRFDSAWQIYISDPDGYVIELNEPKPVK